MDGYASSVSAVVNGRWQKVGWCFTTPVGAVGGDVDLVKTAPDHMLASGAGDNLGKYVAIRDWRLAQRETGEILTAPRSQGWCLIRADRDAPKACPDCLTGRTGPCMK
jgi:glycerol dehydrogenase-like iron-containing ADH family enzyme